MIEPSSKETEAIEEKGGEGKMMNGKKNKNKTRKHHRLVVCSLKLMRGEKLPSMAAIGIRGSLLSFSPIHISFMYHFL